MKAKIKEVHDYFRDKIVKGEFEIVKPTEHLLYIKIDGEYNFCLWYANTESSIATYSGDTNFINLEFRVKDKRTIYSKVSKIRKKHLLEVVLKDKEDLYKELKKQFEGK